ncbi:MAG: DMT family transporter [Kiritimatiellales bacterium]|nr:DMT family transporter [Kiritimatiellota bacterium]MBL7011334.1 DMT family transporter [Kiritimatiellales bacterium]
MIPPYLFLALISAVAYSFGGLLNKQAMAGGCGFYRVTAFSIWACALLLLPFVFLYDDPLPLDLWFQPLVTAVCFSAGSIFFTLALRTGDLSVVAPVSGIKPVLNALLVSTLLGVTVPATTWIACILSGVALLILRTPNSTTSHSFLRTALITLLAVFSFALCDTCFQHWAKNWGVLRFSAITFSASSLAALALIPLFSTPWKNLTSPAKTHTLAGCALCAIPALCMGLALGRYGHAPEVNVVYSTRALFSIIAVWLLSHKIGSIEHTAGTGVLLRRLAGAAVLMGAIVLMLFGSAR